MQTECNTKAPGKLFLCGEYAVLEGAPAILLAMPQQAEVNIRLVDDGELTLVSDTRRVCSLPQALGETPLVDSVMASLSAKELAPDMLEYYAAGRLSMALDTSSFHRQGQKLGLGSSAALTVALIKALTGLSAPAALIPLASDAHRRLQGGYGSGADIALSVLGQDIIFRQHQAPTPVFLPADIHILYIWTGQAASSQEYLSRLEAWHQTWPRNYQVIINALCLSAEQAAQHLCQQDTQALLSALGAYDRLLEGLSCMSELHFYNPAHIAMRKQVESAGCIYKLSGAGGGDFGLALAAHQEPIAQLAQQLTQQAVFHFTQQGFT